VSTEKRKESYRFHGWSNTRRWFDVVDFLQEQKRLKLYLEEIICISGLSGKTMKVCDL